MKYLIYILGLGFRQNFDLDHLIKILGEKDVLRVLRRGGGSRCGREQEVGNVWAVRILSGV